MLVYNCRSYYLNAKESKVDPPLSFRELPSATPTCHRQSLLWMRRWMGLEVGSGFVWIFPRENAALPCLVLLTHLLFVLGWGQSLLPPALSFAFQSPALQWHNGLSVMYLSGFSQVSGGAVVACCF